MTVLSWLNTFRRFVTVGACAFAVDFLVYYLLTLEQGGAPLLSPLVANLISRPCGGLVSFFFNKKWTFSQWGSDPTHKQFIRFWVVYLISYTLSEIMVYMYHHVLNFSARPTKILAELSVGGFNFLCHRFWTFK